MSADTERGKLDGLLVIMGSLSHGLEQVLGRGAATVTFRAGRKLGLKSEVSQQSSDLQTALQILQRNSKAKAFDGLSKFGNPRRARAPFMKKKGN